MTQEEKAKAYDEALSRASNLHKDAVEMENNMTTKTCEVIFPELKESEDEKIRKEMIEFFKDAKQGLELQERDNNQWQIEQFKIFIAWLEKQGAKVSAIEGFETEFERQVSYLIASAISKEYEYNQGYVKWTANALLNYAKHELEKQGWQKPADKVESKFNVGDWITPKDRGHEPWQIMQVDISDKKYRFKDGYIIHFSQEDAYELVEQKPAWSEEDEKILNSLISSLVRIGASTRTDSTSINYTFSKEIDWLKSLKDRVQLQPKPEWSEEDEYVFNKILNWCVLVNPTSSIFEELPKDKFVEKLKSLKDRVQPQNTWKPSDKQMELLKEACDQHWEPDGLDPLYTLYQDLKKLKE